MTIEKVDFYHRSEDDGKLYKITLNKEQYYFAIYHCHDYNSLYAFLETIAKWKEIDKDE